MERMETTLQQFGTPKRVILGTVNPQNNGSPISPMANLKLLTKVATGYVSVDKATEQYIIISPEKKTSVKYARQLRSLSYICKKFLEFYELDLPEGKQKQLSLGQLTVLLGIEKRRVYDIINIAASLKFTNKVCKDKYTWYGNRYLVDTLCQLRSYAFANNYHIKLRNHLSLHLRTALPQKIFENAENFQSKDKNLFDDNRIGALCQKCMMLFLVAPKGEALNFKVISSVILPYNIPDKTGMRRLYDISNVLESLGLITRVDSNHLKKPSFIYSGPELPDIHERNQLLASTSLLPDLESSSDSSLDGPDAKFQDILEVVCTEMNELERELEIKEPDTFNCQVRSGFEGVSAKKKLFPDEANGRRREHSGFVRAPQRSFRWSPNGFVRIPELKKPESVETLQPLTQALPAPMAAPSNQPALFSINSIAKPIDTNRYQFSNTPSSVQIGGLYKAVKEGNTIHLIKLE